MPKTLKVLIVADAEHDVTLLLGCLQAAGYLAEHRHVQTPTGLDDALRTSDWDIVLARNRAEKCPLRDVQHCLLQRERPTPLIVLSDEQDIRLAGGDLLTTTQYLTTDELHKLDSTISGVLESLDRQSTYATGQGPCHASGFDALVASMPVGVVVVGQDGLVSYANTEAARLLDTSSPRDLVGNKVPIHITPNAEAGVIKVQCGSDNRPRIIDVRPSHIQWSGKESMLLTMHDVTLRQQQEDHLRESFRDLAYSMSRAMASRDPYTRSHQRRVADLVVLVGARMGLSDGQLWDLRLGGLLHDIGKVAIPDEILAKPGRLETEELRLAHTHAERGYEILRGARLSPVIAQMALHHHEALDGSGYPQQLSTESLSIEDRILIPCNLVESLSSFRLYRRPLGVKDTLTRLRSGRGTLHDPAVVDCLIDIVESGQFALGNLSAD